VGRIINMNGRCCLASIMIGVGIICVFVGTVKGYSAIWSIWHIPVMTPYFADARNLTGGAESIENGYDPLYENPGDPWGRPLNHPRLLQHILSGLGINQEHTLLMGVLLIFLFFGGVFLAFKRITIETASILALVIFSPAVMLGIERGNHDLFIFFLVSLALYIANGTIASMIILLLASFIKLFPAFSVLYLLKYDRTKCWVTCLCFIGIFAMYLLLNSHDLSQIYHSTLKGSGVLSYGSRCFSDSVQLLPSYLSLVVIVLGILILHLGQLRSQGVLPCNLDHIDAFRMGAGIYLGTFFLGNNWSYRLMFLIFTIPQLVTWRDDGQRRLVAVLTLIGIITEYDSQIYIDAEPSNMPLLNELYRRMGNDTDHFILGLSANTIRDLGGLLTFFDLLICNDSGPGHVARAVATPTLSIFSPYSIPSGWIFDLGQQHRAVFLKERLPPECSGRKYRQKHGHIWMERITPVEVISELDKMIMDLKLV